MNVLCRLLIALILFSCCHLYSQSKSQLNWTTDSESLPQNSIKSIAPDKYGFIWMSTENGLVRYDGREFQVYDNNNIGIKNNRIVHILGNYRSDSLYTTNEFKEDYILINKRTAFKTSLPKYSRSLGYQFNTDTTLIASGNINFFWNSAKKSRIIIPMPSGSHYIIQNNKVSFYDDKNRLRHTSGFDYDDNSNFFVLGESLFYLKNNSEYAIIANGKIRWNKLGLAMEKNSKMYWNTVSRQVFIYSNKNLYTINYNSGKLTCSLLIENENLMASNVCCMYYDTRSNIVYLGSIKKGLGIYRIQPFTAVTPTIFENPELYEVFYALSPFTDTTAISASGIIMNNRKIINNLHFITDKFSMAIDPGKNIWVKKDLTLYCYRSSTHYKNPLHWPFPYNISTLFLGKDGNIWFDLNHNDHSQSSIWYFRPDVRPVFHKFMNVPFKVNYFTQLHPNTIWIGSNKGLHKIDIQNRKLYSYPATAQLKIRNVYLTDENNIWLSTYEKGFHLFRDGKLSTFPIDKNNFIKSSHSIVEDKKGYFWISTNKGLFQMKKQYLVDYADKKSKTVYYHYYDKEYGFFSNEFNGGSQPNGIMLKNATIFFPSINGVVNFNPYKIHPILPDSAIYIDKIEIDGKKNAITDTINLDSHFGRITFYIDSPYYGNQHNLNFEVKLDGPDPQDWTAVSQEHTISFSKLSPGTYELTVRKIKGFDGTYNYKKITVFIKPAFWQTAWFYILCCFCSFLLIFLLYSLRVSYISNKNKLLQKTIDEKTRDLKTTISTLLDTESHLKEQVGNNTKIIKYITHDIKSPLKFISMVARYMYDCQDQNREEQKENLKSIVTSSTQMYNFIDNLLEYSKVYTDMGEADSIPSSLYDSINTKIALFSAIAHYQKTEIKNLIPKDYTIRVNKHLLSISIHNLLDNAVKHTHNGQIVFSSYSSENNIHIQLKDTGSGMTKETLDYYRAMIHNYNSSAARNSQRLGLQIVIELMLSWGGTITIDSIENKGTTITLVFSKTTMISKTEE